VQHEVIRFSVLTYMLRVSSARGRDFLPVIGCVWVFLVPSVHTAAGVT